MRAGIESSSLEFNDERIRFTMSFGLSQARPADVDGEAAIVRADGLLYKAKKEGRNRSVTENPSDEYRR